jgi:type IV secretion system protein VirD4
MDYEARFESKETFYASFSKYHLHTSKFGVKTAESFPYGGGGGVPLAWREEDKTVFLDTSDSHTLIIGATGSKKSRLLVMPTVKLLGCAGESMIITDPKAEIYERNAAELSKNGYKIFVINLRNPSEGNCWNPLEIPYQLYCTGHKDKSYECVNDIATNLMLSEMSTNDPYWDYSAGDLFLGLTLLLFRICKENNLSSELVNISSLLLLRRKIFENYMSYEKFIEKPIGRLIEDDDIIEASLIGSIGNAQVTQKNIMCLFDNKMRTFMIQPTLSQMLSKNDIQLNLIGEQKTAVFLIMPDEKTSYHKLISVFIKQSYEYLIYQAQNQPHKTMPIRINYVLDEFSSLPTIKDFPSMISAARSRNIRFNLVIQSKHQLTQRYAGEAETIQSNCLNWVFLTSRELLLLNDISALCGTRAGGNKPLISVSELQRFNKKKGEILILSDRRRPFKGCLPDIDKYDGNKFEILDLPFNKAIKDTSLRKEFEDKLDGLLSGGKSKAAFEW